MPLIRSMLTGLVLLLAAGMAQAAGSQDYAKPLLPSGPDPWVVQRDGVYYYTATSGNRIELRKTGDLRPLAHAQPVVVWRPPAQGPGSTAVWAPELHFVEGKWYLYFTAAEAGHNDDDHRHVFVLENASPDPTRGRWIARGMLKTAHTGIDGTVFKHGRRWYFVYSAYVGDHSDLVIAPMVNPWTLGSPQVDIAAPTYAWEKQGGRKILEGPEFLPGPDGKVFLSYSASACWSDDYALGLLQADGGADLLDPAAWHKSPRPVFASSPEHGIYAPGHNGFFKDTQGRDWIIYHANGGPDWKCTARRAPRIQPIGWTTDGRPNFGEPGAPPLKKP
jgi:GH43 family beta-xylosidase